MSVITQERPETDNFITDDMPLNEWVNLNRADVIKSQQTSIGTVSDQDPETNPIADATESLSNARDTLMVNLLHRLGNNQGLQDQTANYIRAELANYPLDRVTQFAPNIDAHNKLNIYGIAVGQLVQSCLETSVEQANNTSDQLKQKLGAAVWVMTNEVTIRQKLYRNLTGDNKQIDDQLQTSEFHNPSVLLEVGQPELEKISEYHGHPAQWLANWADRITVEQFNIENALLEQTLTQTKLEKMSHKKTRIWPQLLGFLTLSSLSVNR